MSGDIKQVQVGDKAPEPDDGVYHVIQIDKATEQMEIRWEAKGRTFSCWVPMDAFEKVTQQ